MSAIGILERLKKNAQFYHSTIELESGSIGWAIEDEIDDVLVDYYNRESIDLLPKFLSRDIDGKISVNCDSKTDVTKEWNDWKIKRGV
ncbi:hypothetical protein [Algoriphagus resistens]|uniref:hypothetical protein n=1 Tax=Algoriphagus resistens TaxID=1750590 RepID=UPI000716AE54|nr:hypothetical protein [Algoriphagus resistens]